MVKERPAVWTHTWKLDWHVNHHSRIFSYVHRWQAVFILLSRNISGQSIPHNHHHGKNQSSGILILPIHPRLRLFAASITRLQYKNIGAVTPGSFVLTLIRKFTSPLERSPRYESNKSSARKEIHHILWKPKFHYRFHKSPPKPSKRSPQTLIKYFKIYLNIKSVMYISALQVVS